MGETGSCSDGGAMLSKSLIQFSVDGGSCAPSLLFDLRPNYGGGSEDDGELLQNALAHTAALSAAVCEWDLLKKITNIVINSISLASGQTTGRGLSPTH